MPRIDGIALAQELEQDVKNACSRLGFQPTLAILQVGSDAASSLYIQKKCAFAERVGIRTLVTKTTSTATDEELKELIQQWNTDDHIHGILVQLPLEGKHDTDTLLALLDPKKDIDAFHPRTERIVSPVHEAVLRLIAKTPISLPGSVAALITNSDTFADPLAKLLKLAGCVVHSYRPDELDTHALKQADIVIIAIGRAHFLHPTLTKDHAIIIDIGINRENGKLKGDADTEAFLSADHWITPVPGGVGPVTIACAMNNLVTLAQ